MADPSRDHTGDMRVPPVPSGDDDWPPDPPRLPLPDGQEATLQSLLLGNWMITIGPAGAGTYDRAWHYSSLVAAVMGFGAWIDHYDEMDEPTGWFRAVDGTGRRRLDGNPDREYIQW